MAKDDGGPAYPVDWVDVQPGTGEQIIREQWPGMSLRDVIAWRVLVSLFMQDRYGDWTPDMAAEKAYAYADAMLRVKERADG